MMEGSDFSRMPADCMSTILSLTSPLDVCRFSTVSTGIRSAAESDDVWGKFLPHDYQDMLSRSTQPLEFSSKKELFFRLCRPFLIDGGRRSFWLDKSTGKKCYMMSARDLSIAWVDDERYWRWPNDPKCIFNEVAELTMSWWFEIWGSIDTANLSPNTTYSVRLVMRNKHEDYRWNLLPFALSLRRKDDANMRRSRRRAMLDVRFLNDAADDLIQPSPENEGWVEVNVGEFFCDGKGGEIEFRMKEVHELKKGFVVMGVVAKPSKLSLPCTNAIPNNSQALADSLNSAA